MRPSVLRWQEFENFVAASCEDFLDHCSTDQFFKTAEKYELDLSSHGDNGEKRPWLDCSCLRKLCWFLMKRDWVSR